MKNTFQKIQSSLLALLCMVLLISSTSHAAVTSTPLETNNTWVPVSLTGSTEPVYYSITLPSDGTLSLTCQNETASAYWALYSEDLTTELFDSSLTSGSINAPKASSEECLLKSGTYLLKIYTYRTSLTGDISIKAQFESFPSTDMEPNDSPTQAMVLPGKTEVTGLLATNDSEDYFKITIPKSGTITFKFVSNVYLYDVEILDMNLISIRTEDFNTYNKPTEAFLIEYLDAGTYYLKISKTNSSHVGNYSFQYDTDVATGIQITPSNLTLDVDDTAELSATPIPATTTLPEVEWSSSNEDVVYVRDGSIRAYEPGVATITATATDGSKVYGTCTVIVRPEEVEFRKHSQTSNSITLKWYTVEGADGYRVFKYDTSQKKYVAYKDTKKCNMKISKLKTEKKYKYKVIAYINANGQKVLGTDAGEISIWTAPKKPKNTKISSIKKYNSNAQYNFITVKWKKAKNATGYQVYGKIPGGSWELLVSTKKTSTKLFAGKGYTYSIKVRPYRKKHGVTTYGKWTKVKKYRSR